MDMVHEHIRKRYGYNLYDDERILLDHEIYDIVEIGLKDIIKNNRIRMIVIGDFRSYIDDEYVDKFVAAHNDLNLGTILSPLGPGIYYYLVGQTKAFKFQRYKSSLIEAINNVIKDKEEYEAEQDRIRIRRQELMKSGKRKIRCECCNGVLPDEIRDDGMIKCSFCDSIQNAFIPYNI